jgi:hypothetical protein
MRLSNGDDAAAAADDDDDDDDDDDGDGDGIFDDGDTIGIVADVCIALKTSVAKLNVEL